MTLHRISWPLTALAAALALVACDRGGRETAASTADT
jgi:hypothetical protein